MRYDENCRNVKSMRVSERGDRAKSEKRRKEEERKEGEKVSPK